MTAGYVMLVAFDHAQPKPRNVSSTEYEINTHKNIVTSRRDGSGTEGRGGGGGIEMEEEWTAEKK